MVSEWIPRLVSDELCYSCPHGRRPDSDVKRKLAEVGHGTGMIGQRPLAPTRLLSLGSPRSSQVFIVA